MKAQLKGGKERRIRPLKQPVKATRAPILLDQIARHQEESVNFTEKDKLKKAMGSMVAVADEHKNNNRQNICSKLLQSGNVQSFIDLFYISHKCLPNVMEEKWSVECIHYGRVGAPMFKGQHLKTSKLCSRSLAKAEVRPDSERAQKESALSEYNSMAFNYEDQRDFITASYFYKKVLELALSTRNKQYELVGLLGLGKCHEQVRMREKAIELLDEAFDSACTTESKETRQDMVKMVGKELIDIYMGKAEESVKSRVDEALRSYQSALNIAQRSNQRDSEAQISHKIGELYYIEGQYQKSVEFQEQYLTKLKQAAEEEQSEEEEKREGQLSLKFKEMEAHASLAKCYLKLKEIEQAEIHLNQYHRMAKEAKAQNAVADSSYYLGKLFQEKGDKERAITYYQSYFEAAKSEKPDKKDRNLVDKARVTFAIAKANKNITKYIGLFDGEDSLPKILEWKIKRILK